MGMENTYLVMMMMMMMRQLFIVNACVLYEIDRSILYVNITARGIYDRGIAVCEC